jgi:hypothetical protein
MEFDINNTIEAPAANSSSADMESEARAANHRDWIIALRLDRTLINPKVCLPFLVVTDRPGSGKNDRDECRLTYTITFPPRRLQQLPAVEPTEDQHEEDSEEDNGVISGEFDEDGWTIASTSKDDESSVGSTPESDGESSDFEEVTHEEETTSNEFVIQYATINLSKGETHTFIHNKVGGLAGWNGDLVKVLVGPQHIEFVVPAFLLINNFEFFRAIFEVGRWSEGAENTVILAEDSPVDFVLLLRFLVHTLVNDFNEVNDLFYPFRSNSNPMKPHEEYEGEYTIAPWMLRVVAMAERLCWIGASTRLTDVLDGTLKPSKADRISLPLMDWLYTYSAKETVLRGWVYNRILQSICSGDINPTVYKDYAEEDPELMRILLQGMVEHPLMGLGVGFDEYFTTYFQSLPDGDQVSARASVLGRDFESNWIWVTMLHRSIHNKTPSCVETAHMWDDDVGWIGCRPGMNCIGCWNNDLGGTREQISRVLVLECWDQEGRYCDDGA